MSDSSLSVYPTSFAPSKLLSSSSLGPVYSSRLTSVALSLDEGCRTALSTAVIGSSITLSAFYLAGVQEHARLCYRQSSSVLEWLDCLLSSSPPGIPQLPRWLDSSANYVPPKMDPFSDEGPQLPIVRWLDSSADYVPPKMDLFSDDNAPLGFSSSPACPVYSEHLERSFDLLRYQHAIKQLGVPSVVDHGVRIVSRPSGSQSHDGTSTTSRFVSDSPGDSPNPFFDRPRRSRTGGSNNGASSGSGDGSGSGDNAAGSTDGSPTWRKPSDQRAYKLGRFGSPPPPPPPPPPSYFDVDDDDDGPRSSTSDWDIAWKAILLGAAVGHLLNKFFPNKKLFRKFSRTAPLSRLEPNQLPLADAVIIQNEVDIFGLDEGLDRELESGVTTSPAFVDDVLRMDTDVRLNGNHTDGQPVETLPVLTAPLPYDSFLSQLLTFAAGTGKAVVVLLLLVLCAVLRTIVKGIRLRLTATMEEVSTVVVDDQFEQAADNTVEANDDAAEVLVEATAPEGLELDVDSTAVFGNAWVWAHESQSPVEATDAPVEDSNSDATVAFENLWMSTESHNPVEGLVLVEDSHSEVLVSDDDAGSVWPLATLAPVEDSECEAALPDDNSFWSTSSRPRVDTPAPVEDSDSERSFSDSGSFWTTESLAPVEALQVAPVEDTDNVSESSVDGHFDAEVESGHIPIIRVEAPAPESGSSYDASPSSDRVQMGASFLRTKQDDFDWDRHGSFQCSTPLTRATGTLSEAESFDYARGFFEESLGVSAPDPASCDTTTNTPTVSADALQELEITKKHLDIIVEAQIKRAEASCANQRRFETHLRPRNLDRDMDRSISSSIWASTPEASSARQGRVATSQRSLSSSMWASTTGPSSGGQSDRLSTSQRSLSSSMWASTPSPSSSGQGDRLSSSQRSLSSSMWASTPETSSASRDDRRAPPASSRLSVGARPFTPLPHFPVNNAIRTPNPNASQMEVKTLQQAPGRRRRHRQRGRNRGRGPSGEQQSEEEEDVGTDVPDWANA